MNLKSAGGNVAAAKTAIKCRPKFKNMNYAIKFVLDIVY